MLVFTLSPGIVDNYGWFAVNIGSRYVSYVRKAKEGTQRPEFVLKLASELTS